MNRTVLMFKEIMPFTFFKDGFFMFAAMDTSTVLLISSNNLLFL